MVFLLAVILTLLLTLALRRSFQGHFILGQYATPSDSRAMPDVRKPVEAVRDSRRASKSTPTKKLADTPMLYHVTVIPKRPFLVVPEVSSEQREYVPIGYSQVIDGSRLAPQRDIAFAITSNRAESGHLTGEVSLRFRRKLSKVLKRMVGPCGLEPQTCTVSKAN
jgi:hypothetical protein